MKTIFGKQMKILGLECNFSHMNIGKISTLLIIEPLFKLLLSKNLIKFLMVIIIAKLLLIYDFNP
jgi:hypothetical protein